MEDKNCGLFSQTEIFAAMIRDFGFPKTLVKMYGNVLIIQMVNFGLFKSR